MYDQLRRWHDLTMQTGAAGNPNVSFYRPQPPAPNIAPYQVPAGVPTRYLSNAWNRLDAWNRFRMTKVPSRQPYYPIKPYRPMPPMPSMPMQGPMYPLRPLQTQPQFMNPAWLGPRS